MIKTERKNNMNVFTPSKPKIVLFLDSKLLTVKGVANNVDPNIEVEITSNKDYFDVLKKGLSFQKEND